MNVKLFLFIKDKKKFSIYINIIINLFHKKGIFHINFDKNIKPILFILYFNNKKTKNELHDTTFLENINYISNTKNILDKKYDTFIQNRLNNSTKKAHIKIHKLHFQIFFSKNNKI